eukprot:TRINITY_DN58474_c0_g1_i1.p1 TRINITY_DN58474_c0_g1~~TRINITY_DN58474_c0_g1_i1.p1  ORF type:complete len:117 (+),score=44.46 TRINITY_DN58474_c0_g1_i1:55-405(+)
MYSFFFFKQKTAYEMLRSLVGSEMCIRDSLVEHALPRFQQAALDALVDVLADASLVDSRPSRFVDSGNSGLNAPASGHDAAQAAFFDIACLLYTSDAADEEDSVDLGGRRILKKKT